MSGATEEVATGAEVNNAPRRRFHINLGWSIFKRIFAPQVVDLLVAMCRSALQSSRKSIIFEPYPSVVDPKNPKMLAFSPKVSPELGWYWWFDMRIQWLSSQVFLFVSSQRKSFERLEKALDSVLLIRSMTQVNPTPLSLIAHVSLCFDFVIIVTQGSYSEIKTQMDKMDPLALPLLQWWDAKHIELFEQARQFNNVCISYASGIQFALWRGMCKIQGASKNWHHLKKKYLTNYTYYAN